MRKLSTISIALLMGVSTAYAADATQPKMFQNESASVGGFQDSDLGFVAELHGATNLLDDRHAAALELAHGENVNRVNLTYGAEIGEKSRLKLTGERLSEKKDYGFATGSQEKWDGQNAVGADYAYNLDQYLINDVGLGGYYTHSGSKYLEAQQNGFKDRNFYQNEIFGAHSGNLHADASAHLWLNSRLTAGVDYDAVNFSNTDDVDVNGFGGHAKLEQLIIPSLKLTLDTQYRQSEHSYKGSLGWLVSSPKGMQAEVEAFTSYVNDLATDNDYNQTGLALKFDFGVEDAHKVYNDLMNGSRENLMDWTRDSAVRTTEVLSVS
jgi:hypothetical protein